MQPATVGYWVGVFAGGFVVGLLCGLVPFFVGRKKDRASLGVAGLIACVVSGLILGIILALPVAIIFTAVIVVSARKGPELPPTSSGPPS